MLGSGTGSKGNIASALVACLLANRLHILLILCCGGVLFFFFFFAFWLLLLLFDLRGGSSDSLEELYPKAPRSRCGRVGRGAGELDRLEGIVAAKAQLVYSFASVEQEQLCSTVSMGSAH